MGTFVFTFPISYFIYIYIWKKEPKVDCYLILVTNRLVSILLDEFIVCFDEIQKRLCLREVSHLFCFAILYDKRVFCLKSNFFMPSNSVEHQIGWYWTLRLMILFGLITIARFDWNWLFKSKLKKRRKKIKTVLMHTMSCITVKK